MKKISIFLLTIVAMYSCATDFIDDDTPSVINFPFETLDQTNFNNATQSLTAPPTNIRLDSVVYYRFYNFNPNTGTSSYDQYNRSENITYAPPPPEPTGRTSEHFTYYENGFVKNKVICSNQDYRNVDIKKRGGVIGIQFFDYDENSNLIQSGYQDLDDTSLLIIKSIFNYDQNAQLIQLNMNDGYTSKFSKNGNELKVQTFYHTDILTTTNVYTIDHFNNIIKNIETYSNGENAEFFNYPKNIFHPFVNLFPSNFYPHLIMGAYSGGFTHFSSGRSNSYYESIQLNEFGFPEIIQFGSYDDGYRTKYYYSIIN